MSSKPQKRIKLNNDPSGKSTLAQTPASASVQTQHGGLVKQFRTSEHTPTREPQGYIAKIRNCKEGLGSTPRSILKDVSAKFYNRYLSHLPVYINAMKPLSPPVKRRR